uniref:(S)-3-amino-2-methylpropionate transaminase n=1 Tax=Romanomermis culicivorax TaxID=13658 RepID=A0A915K3H0_ROMCU
MFVRKLSGLNSATKELNFSSRRFAAFASAVRRTPLIIHEPEYPLIKTPIPGPISKKLKSELDKIQNATGVCYFVDPEKCAGNYVVDADGNAILDAYMMVASLPLGYNHPDLIETCKQPHSLSIAVSRPALGFYPTIDYVGHLNNALLSVAPKGHRQVQTMMCGATANENALKVAMIMYQTRKRGGRSPTDAELKAAILNQPPGCPNLSVLSFENAFHGRMFACLSASRSKAIHKVDLPAFDWPMAPFPRYEDPVDSNSEKNRAEDDRCLAEVERLIKKWAEKDKPVAAIIVEPIQAEGGDNYGSAEFFRKLQTLVKKHGCAFIVDEVQTGCGATGRMWAHEEWNLERPPDMVTFSKKMLLGGFYYTDEYRIKEPYRIFNTWMGDPIKLALLETVIKTIRRDDLLGLNRESGKVLLGGLKDLERKFPNAISNSRGKGTFVAFDVNSADKRKHILDELLKKGIQLGYCGERTVRFRPALIFQPTHAKLCLEKIEDVLQEMIF